MGVSAKTKAGSEDFRSSGGRSGAETEAVVEEVGVVEVAVGLEEGLSAVPVSLVVGCEEGEGSRVVGAGE